MHNRGIHQYRFRTNPLEKRFAEHWEKLNVDYFGNLTGNKTLDYILAKDNNRPRNEVSDRDREVAATIIQWLGSPVGQAFLKEVLNET